MQSTRQVKVAFFGAVVCFGIAAVPASAAGYAGMFHKTGLTPQDVEMAQSAAQSLYAKPGVAKGEAATWSNAQSGASGRVEVLQVGGTPNCVVYLHDTKAANNQNTRIEYRRCKNAQGQWELTP